MPPFPVLSGRKKPTRCLAKPLDARQPMPRLPAILPLRKARVPSAGARSSRHGSVSRHASWNCSVNVSACVARRATRLLAGSWRSKSAASG